jgi:membrane fusion protein, hemolysin D
MKRAEVVPMVAAARRELRRRDELAFLPAALEIVETPPSPLGRALVLTIVAAFCLALVWASLGKVDIIASAPGKIVPSGRVKLVQPFETGVVRAIHVQDGESVRKGQLLIELDPTISDAELDHLRDDLMAARLDVARLEAAVAAGDDPLAAFKPPPGADPALVATERQLVLNQVAEQQAKLAALERQRAEKEAERESHIATIAKLRATIPLLQQRADIRKYLADRGYGSKLTYLETEGDLVEQQKQLAVEASTVEADTQAVAGLDAARVQLVATYHSDRLGELATAEQKVAGLEQDVVKATERTKLQRLVAPVDGTVQQLAVHTVGGVVTPAEPLLEVVPRDSRLEIEAVVSNQDVGFIHAGQTAQIKVDTFNFTKYGLLHGTVLEVSPDAVPRDRNGAPTPAPGQGGSVDANAQDLVYTARVGLDRSAMEVDGKRVDLTPGMAVTVEIKTGSRRVISYLLSPLLRFHQEALRER